MLICVTGMCEAVGNESSPRYIIDLSTPETLERDFYAWLKVCLSHLSLLGKKRTYPGD